MLRWKACLKIVPLATAMAVLLSTSVASAATTTPTTTTTPTATSGNIGNALRISPVRQDLTIKPGSSQTIDVYVENLTTQSITLQGIANDFTANNDESGTPSILLNPNSYAPTHGLKRYIQPISNITLNAKEQKDVKVTITIPAGAAGGGYFGAVRFAPVASDNSKNVSLTASVGSLILVTVPGSINEQLSVAGFGVGKGTTIGSLFTSNKDLQAIVRFRNTGNVQVEPFGKILLKKGDKTLATYEINNTDPRGNVLPDSIRRFTTPLTNLGYFGKYTVQGNFGYGTKGQLLTTSATFYVVPVSLIAAIIGGLIVILFLIFVLPRMIRSYNQRIIRRASGGSKR